MRKDDSTTFLVNAAMVDTLDDLQLSMFLSSPIPAVHHLTLNQPYWPEVKCKSLHDTPPLCFKPFLIFARNLRSVPVIHLFTNR